jgi:hypothetical protein
MNAGYSNDNPRNEGRVAKAIEQQTSRLPSDLFLWGAAGAWIASGILSFAAVQRFRAFGPPRLLPIARAVGSLAPIFLILGVYNKLVKVVGPGRRLD